MNICDILSTVRSITISYDVYIYLIVLFVLHLFRAVVQGNHSSNNNHTAQLHDIGDVIVVVDD